MNFLIDFPYFYILLMVFFCFLIIFDILLLILGEGLISFLAKRSVYQ